MISQQQHISRLSNDASTHINRFMRERSSHPRSPFATLRLTLTASLLLLSLSLSTASPSSSPP
ncbi:MAG: hypothetical protein P8077_08805, partial [Gammaproteobacteria bacterium]